MLIKDYQNHTSHDFEVLGKKKSRGRIPKNAFVIIKDKYISTEMDSQVPLMAILLFSCESMLIFIFFRGRKNGKNT